MANDKEFINPVEIKLECLRIATEFGTENERRDPIQVAQNYFDWVMSEKNSTRKSVKTSKKNDEV
jgi:hypothetical protein